MGDSLARTVYDDPVTVEPLLVLIIVAVVANLIVMAVLVVSPRVGHRGPGSVDPPRRPVRTRSWRPPRSSAAPAMTSLSDEATTRAYDRIVRIVGWVFILATTVIVGVSGLWAANQAAILALLALTGLFMLVVHDLLPPTALGTAKFVVEGSVAVTVATLLVALTGGVASPFFFTYPLIVGGAALVVSPAITVALTGTATLGYILAVVLGSPAGITPSAAAATVGINLTALILLAYAAMVIAREQRRTRDAAVRLSTIDPLTGLFNRGFFFAALEREIARSARSSRGFCLLMMDLDELKAINDRHGHFHGDRVLRGVGDVVQAGVRRIDTAARYGGDEFVVLLPETDPTGAYVVAEKIRLGVEAMPVSLPGHVRGSVPVHRRRQLPRRRDDRGRADDQRRWGDVRQQAQRQEPGDGGPAPRRRGADGCRCSIPVVSDEPRHPTGFSTRAIRAASRVPQVDQRPDQRAHLPVGDVHLGRCRRSSATSPATRVPATPTAASPTRRRPRSGRPTPSWPVARPGSPWPPAWAPSTPPSRLAAPGRRPGRRPERDLRLDPDAAGRHVRRRSAWTSSSPT